MLQANELRVGNWVNKNGLPIQVGAIEFTAKYIVYAYGLPSDLKDLQPISLNAEILEEAGFKNVGFGNGPKSIKYQKDYVVLFFDKVEGAAFFCYYEDENRKKGRTIRTLHDLQNFYFALNSKELEINL